MYVLCSNNLKLRLYESLCSLHYFLSFRWENIFHEFNVVLKKFKYTTGTWGSHKMKLEYNVCS